MQEMVSFMRQNTLKITLQRAIYFLQISALFQRLRRQQRRFYLARLELIPQKPQKINRI